MEAFKINEALPSIILAGARESNRGKLLAGVSRAAFRSDAVIIDSGVSTGIESYCLRRSKILCLISDVKLFGVFPEAQISLPKINPTQRELNELTNGHTHLFMDCSKDAKEWGVEAKAKYQIAKK